MSAALIGSQAEAFWGGDGTTRAVGKVIAVSVEPMVLIETDTGERVWWTISLTRPASPVGGAS